MDDDSYLVYEQDEVHQLAIDCEDDCNAIGKLRIIEKEGEPVVEWVSNSDCDSSDGEWALISSPESPPNVLFSHTKLSDSITISNVNKRSSAVVLKLEPNYYCKITDNCKKLEIFDKYEKKLASFLFSDQQHADFFLDVIRRYFGIRERAADPSMYLLQNKHQADIDDKLSALNLVPARKSPRHKKHHHQHGDHQHWVAEAPKKMWGFINNMKRDPYTTTLTTFSKVYDIVLYPDYNKEEVPGREESEDVGELLQRISGMDDLEPGYEILTKRENLAERPEIDRLGPLLHEEFKTFVDSEGRITNVNSLKERIFRGGIHPNLRPELWCYLLGLYDWHMTYTEREERKRMKEHEYFVMKQQWKTFYEAQEKNFSGYRDRKSLIEKDVNRTDRNHPFYEGEINSNLEMLNDILMTYVMFNFDLGYVQGMSDLLAPILYVMQTEALSFWCFVGFMDRVYRNFDLDQSGMKQQLNDLSQVLRIIDPEFVSFLEVQDSANLYFCFRWILVRFKREFNYADTLRLWEVLWTDHLCSNFHLLVAASILDTERGEIVKKKFGFTDVLKHVNGLCLSIDLDLTLKKAEAIYVQLSRSKCVPNSIRSILGLPHLESPKNSWRISPEPVKGGGLPGKAERVMTSEESSSSVIETVTSVLGSAVNHLATGGAAQTEEEFQFENSVSQAFL